MALAATGAWTAERAAELEKSIDETAQRYAHARNVDIDLAKLERLDTFGAWLIERLKRAFTARGSTARIVGLSDADRGLMEELRLVNRTPAERRRRGKPHPGRARLRSAAPWPRSAGRWSCSRIFSAR